MTLSNGLSNPISVSEQCCEIVGNKGTMREEVTGGNGAKQRLRVCIKSFG